MRRLFLSRTGAVALTLSIAMAAAPAHASSVLALELPQITASADQVVVGDVMSAKSAWSPRRRVIVTTVEISVVEIWKGEMPRERKLTIVQTGGSVGDIEMKVHGLCTFTVGERAVLFLRGTGVSSVVGLGQGKRLLTFDAAGGRWIAGAPDRSAAVTLDAQGRIQPAAPESAMPLDDLRRSVRVLVKP